MDYDMFDGNVKKSKSTSGNKSKQFHNKARTGCITCRKRRVKCDEGKPTCHRCLRGKHKCLGYVVSATLVFENDLNVAELESILQIDSKHVTTDSSFSTMVARLNVANGDCVRKIQKNTPFPLQIDCPSGTLEEQQAFNFWLTETGRNIETYGPSTGLYNVLLPQCALRSSAIKHFLVAQGLMHKNFAIDDGTLNSRLGQRSLHHFQLGLQLLSRNESSPLYLILASIVAWSYEMMIKEFQAAKVHLAHTERLLGDVETAGLMRIDQISLDAIAHYVKPAFLLCRAYSIASYDLLDDGNGETEEKTVMPFRVRLTFRSLPEARDLLIEKTQSYCSLKYPTFNDSTQHRRFVTSWHYAKRLYVRASLESYPHKWAVQLLCNVSYALLAEDQVGPFSYQANPRAIDDVLDAVDIILSEQQRGSSWREKADIDLTLRAVLELIMWNFNEFEVQERSRNLLRALQNDSSLFLH